MNTRLYDDGCLVPILSLSLIHSLLSLSLSLTPSLAVSRSLWYNVHTHTHTPPLLTHSLSSLYLAILPSVSLSLLTTHLVSQIKFERDKDQRHQYDGQIDPYIISKHCI